MSERRWASPNPRRAAGEDEGFSPFDATPEPPCTRCGSPAGHRPLCAVQLEIDAIACSDPDRIAGYRRWLPDYDPVKVCVETAEELERLTGEDARRLDAAGWAKHYRAVASMVEDLITLAGAVAPTTTPAPVRKGPGETAVEYLLRRRAAEAPATTPAPKKKGGRVTWDQLFKPPEEHH